MEIVLTDETYLYRQILFFLCREEALFLCKEEQKGNDEGVGFRGPVMEGGHGNRSKSKS